MTIYGGTDRAAIFLSEPTTAYYLGATKMTWITHLKQNRLEATELIDATRTRGFEPGPRWKEASALTTAPSLSQGFTFYLARNK